MSSIRILTESDVPWLTTAMSWLQLACLLWILWLPVSYSEFLYPALAGVLGTSVVLIVLKRLAMPGELRWMAAIYSALVAYLVLYAFVLGNPGATHQSTLWVGVPLIWGSWALTLRGDQLRRTIWAMVLSTGATSLVVVWLAIHALGGPLLLPAWLVDMQQFGFSLDSSTQIEMRYMGLSSLIGLAVLTLALACLPATKDFLPPMWLIRVAAALAFVAAVVSGRRGLTVIAILAPVMCVAWASLMLARRTWEGAPARKYWRDASIAAVAVALIALSPLGTNLASLVGAHGGFIDWSGVVGPEDQELPTTQAGTTTSPDPPTVPNRETEAPAPNRETEAPAPSVAMDAGEDVVRIDQASELIAQWRAKPLLGHGLGAVMDTGYERNSDRPWMFENQPLQVLMNIGLLGTAVLGLLNWFMLRLVRRAWSSGALHRLILASVITLVLTMLANATNPYLAAPGHGWAVFLLAGVCVGALAEGAQTGSDPVADRGPTTLRLRPRS